jgi:hypothetical protein
MTLADFLHQDGENVVVALFVLIWVAGWAFRRD